MPITTDFETARDAFWAAFATLESAKTSGDPAIVAEAAAEVERLRGPYKAHVAVWLSGITVKE